jgi:hypothetical protein
MPITSLASESSSVRCAICARPARRGTTLCAQCKAALNRARQVPSVHSAYLPNHAAQTGRRPAIEYDETAALRGRTQGASARTALGGWGTYTTLVAFGMAVCLTGYVALGVRDNPSNPGRAMPSIQASAPAAPSDAAGQSGTALPSAAFAGAAFAESSKLNDVPDVTPAPAAPRTADKKLVRDGRPAKDRPASTVIDPGNAMPDPIPAPAPAHEAVATPKPPAAVPAPEPSAPDRWQLLATATASCESENLLAGLLCKERARLQYCDGYWGTAPQCVGSVASNNAR